MTTSDDSRDRTQTHIQLTVDLMVGRYRLTGFSGAGGMR